MPAIANLYPRFWNPDYPPLNFKAGMPPYTGWYEDGFHNKLDIRAVANPVNDPKPGQFPEPVELYREGTGYGIVRFHKPDRTITLEVWPRHVDPSIGRPYDGWPITIAQTDNDGRTPVAWLPTIEVQGMKNPVVQVIDPSNDEVINTLRIKGTSFRPKVFHKGRYTVKVGEPGTERWKTIENVEALEPDANSTLSVDLGPQ